MFRAPLCIFGLLVLSTSTSTLTGQESEPLATPPVALAELGQAVFEVDNLKDNYFQYEARVKELHEAAKSFQGSEAGVLAKVERVTPYEVIVEVPKQGWTRMVLKHEQPPYFGNLGSRSYNGPPSTIRFRIFAKPIGLRIGEEIDIDLAKQLRNGDRLRIAGKIEAMPIQIKSIFDPYVAAVITDWKVISVEAASDAGAEAASY